MMESMPLGTMTTASIQPLKSTSGGRMSTVSGTIQDIRPPASAESGHAGSNQSPETPSVAVTPPPGGGDQTTTPDNTYDGRWVPFSYGPNGVDQNFSGCTTAGTISNALIHVFWSRANLGLAVQEFTREFFDSLPDSVIIFVCVSMKHAIREYESRHRAASKFEEYYVND
jgi:hypothetical protein